MPGSARPPRFDLLGQFTAHHGDIAVVPPVGVQRTVLTALLLANRAVTKYQLINLAWPKSPPDSGGKALHVAVSRLRGWLRAQFPTTTIERNHDSYRLVLGEAQIDAVTFERLAARGLDPVREVDFRVDDLLAALRLWRGPVLDGDSITAHFPAAGRWDLMRVSAACVLVDAAVTTGRHAEAMPMIAELAAERPTDEMLHAAWSRILIAGGRRVEALVVLEAIRARLVDDNGIDPGPVLRMALQQALAERHKVARQHRYDWPGQLDLEPSPHALLYGPDQPVPAT